MQRSSDPEVVATALLRAGRDTRWQMMTDSGILVALAVTFALTYEETPAWQYAGQYLPNWPWLYAGAAAVLGVAAFVTSRRPRGSGHLGVIAWTAVMMTHLAVSLSYLGGYAMYRFGFGDGFVPPFHGFAYLGFAFYAMLHARRLIVINKAQRRVAWRKSSHS